MYLQLNFGCAGEDDLERRWQDFFRDSTKRWDNRRSKPSPRHPDFKHIVTKEPLWMDSPKNPSWVMEKLMTHESATSTDGMGTSDALSPALIWSCCKNKDLQRGTRIHNGIRRRGLVERNYSDALVTLYAKCGQLQKAQALLDMHNSSSSIPWNALIAGYAREGKGQIAFHCFEKMQQEGLSPTAVTYTGVLKACAVIGALDKGKQIHDEISRQGLLEHNVVLGSALVAMYVKCGDLGQAQSVLEKLPSRNVVSWSALMAGYAENGQGQRVLDCFEQMQRESILPNEVTYVCILQACAVIGALDKGKKIHDEISRQGLLHHHVVLGNALVSMYAKCGALDQAQSVLEKLPSRNVVSWNALIAGFAQNGQGQQALDCFKQMQRESISPDEVTYVCVLQACAAIGALDKGKKIHDEISRQGLLQHHVVLGGALVSMYAKCGALVQAESVLEKLPSRDLVSWSALIAGYAQNGQGQQALACFEQMRRESISPDKVTYVSILQACAVTGALDKGKQIHDEISRKGLLQLHVALGNALVSMYAKCGALDQAFSVLEKLPSRNVVSWNALIAGYAQHGQGQQALNCFEQMQLESISPDESTYMSILQACAVIGALDKGKQIHDEISRKGLLQHDAVLGSALVSMYARCGALGQAQSVLEKLYSRNVVSWSAMIAGYARNGQGQQALDCFEQMQQENISPNEVTYVCILQACAVIGALDKGKKIHDEILRQGLLEHHVVLGGALVSMYAKCGALSQAQSVLKKLPTRELVSWSALIAGYAQIEQGQQALDCFEQMRQESISPDEVTYVSVLQACGMIGALDNGKRIHDEISRKGLLQHHVVLGAALVSMYAKCGALRQAQSLLGKLPSRNVTSWNSLIAGYAQNGQVQQALDCFEQMQKENIFPNEVTFICLLNLCSHLGMVEKGQELFDNMEVRYGLKPNIDSFTCMVDLFGRAGHLMKAVELIQGMPFPPDSGILHCLLGACRKWVDINVGTWAFEQALELDKCDGVAYIVMVDICAAAGMLDKVKHIESMRITNKAWKRLGCTTWHDKKNKVHKFCADDTNMHSSERSK